MKNITILVFSIGILLTACNQQEDISGKLNAEINDRAAATIDSLKRACDANFDTALQAKVTAAIKANNKPVAKPKPSIKNVTTPKTPPARATPPPPPPKKPASKGGRKGIGKGGGIIDKNKPVKTAPATKPASNIKTRPGTKNKKGD